MFSKFMGFVVAVCVAILFSACGVSCDSSESKEAFGVKIKDALKKKYPEVKDKIENMQITFDDISTISKDKKAKKSSCSADKINLKLYTGDILTYNNDNSRFKFEVREKEKGVSVITSVSSKVDDIDDDLRTYYSGIGLMIGGVRKGGCNGAYKAKSKSGDNVSGNCVNGLRDGVWIFAKEVEQQGNPLNMLSMALGGGAIKSNVMESKTYKNGLLNGIYKIVVDDEFISLFTYKDGIVDGISFYLYGLFNKSYCGEGKRFEGIDKCPADFGSFNYVEFENGAFILGRKYNKDDLSNIKDEKELFKRLNSLTPESEVVIKQRAQSNAEIPPQNISNEQIITQTQNAVEQNNDSINAIVSADEQIYLNHNNDFVALRKSPNGEVITPIHKKDFDSVTIKRLTSDDSSWVKVLYFPPNISDEKNAIVGYIRTSQIDNNR